MEGLERFIKAQERDYTAALAEINQGKWPLRPGEYAEMDAISQKESDDAERSLLYVALTRAMKHAMLVGVGDAPAEL